MYEQTRSVPDRVTDSLAEAPAPAALRPRGAPPDGTSREEVAALVAEAERGSREAFATLVRLYQDRLFGFLLKYTRHPQDAEDLCQETFLRAYKSLNAYRPVWAFSTWLFTIARHTALNHLRARRPVEELSEDTESLTAADRPAETVAGREDASRLWAMARRLKPPFHEALRLRYAEGLSLPEVARVMNTNQVRVRVLLHRARKQMAGMLSRNPL